MPRSIYVGIFITVSARTRMCCKTLFGTSRRSYSYVYAFFLQAERPNIHIMTDKIETIRPANKSQEK